MSGPVERVRAWARVIVREKVALAGAVSAVWALVHGVLVGSVDEAVVTAAVVAVAAFAARFTLTPSADPRGRGGEPLVPASAVRRPVPPFERGDGRSGSG